MLRFLDRLPRLARLSLVVVTALALAVSSVAVAQADSNDPAPWMITRLGDQTLFNYGQVDLTYQITSSMGGGAAVSDQASLSETNGTLLAVSSVSSGGIVEFTPASFGDRVLSQGPHSLIVMYGDAISPLSITVQNGQIEGSFDSVVKSTTDSTYTFNWRETELGSYGTNVVPAGHIYLIEDANINSVVADFGAPQFTNGVATGSLSGVTIDSGSTYQLWFRHDGNFGDNYGVVWKDSGTAATAISFDGQVSNQANLDKISATVNSDNYPGQIGGSAQLIDNGTTVATASVTGGSKLYFNYASPTAVAHTLQIKYLGQAPFLASTSTTTRTYLPEATPVSGTTTSTTIPVTTSTTAPATTTTTVPATTTTTVPATNTPSSTNMHDSTQGYRLVTSGGKVITFGNATSAGDMSGLPLNKPIIGAFDTATGNGYWLLASDGGIFSFGDAAFYGSMGGRPLNAPIVGMAATPTGHGYWLVASDGGIFSFGDAATHFYGSMGGKPLNKPVVGMTSTASGNGYRLVASDGGIFSFGDAVLNFYGSMGGQHLNKPVVGMVATPDSTGYFLVASDGGVFSFNARYLGSTGDTGTANPVVGVLPTGTGNGYRTVESSGKAHNFGDAQDVGPNQTATTVYPIVAIA